MFEIRFKIFGFRFTLAQESSLYILQLGQFAMTLAVTYDKERTWKGFYKDTILRGSLKDWEILWNKFTFHASYARYLVTHIGLERMGGNPEICPEEIKARAARKLKGHKYA